jgi:hypothetical protein
VDEGGGDRCDDRQAGEILKVMEMRRQNQQRLEQAKDPMARQVLRMTVRQLTGAIEQVETAMRR